MKNLFFLKRQVSKILVNNFTGAIIAQIFKRSIPFRGTTIFVPKEISSSVCAMLFWRTYESAEIRFVNKYIEKDIDVIEIGSSLGGVSCQIGNLIHPKNVLICVEANPNLIPYLEKNIKTNKLRATIINKAIGSESIVQFSVSNNNLIGRVQTPELNKENKKNELIETISLESLTHQYNIKKFNLVCDIEGSEIILIKNKSLQNININKIIIELHQTNYKNTKYTVPQLVNMIEDNGFNILESYGNVYVFKNIKQTI